MKMFLGMIFLFLFDFQLFFYDKILFSLCVVAEIERVNIFFDLF
jgi:hypothetical protein